VTYLCLVAYVLLVSIATTAAAVAPKPPPARPADPEEPMTRREPTINNRALMVECRRCRCVAGAPCMATRGARLKDNKVHLVRAADYRERETARKTREAGR
jgi:hypothetical protein